MADQQMGGVLAVNGNNVATIKCNKGASHLVLTDGNKKDRVAAKASDDDGGVIAVRDAKGAFIVRIPE